MLRRVALITGAAQGIGKSIALRLAKDGFDVAINDIGSKTTKLQHLAELINQAGRRAHVTSGDVSMEDDVERILGSTVEELGSVDVMVANAGVLPLAAPVSSTSVVDWDRTMSVNARGVFLCYKHAARQMISQGRGGRIIGASSAAGKQGQETLGAYSASKFAIRGLTQCTAQELGKYGITVNAYAPGYIHTEMSAEWVKMRGEEVKQSFASALAKDGEPEDIASIVSYLASEEAHFITGQTISVNGGTYFD
ncbi:NAD-binding protein [Moniliophthora roreri MCA 2997]|uniref:NAD-binding protein n=1 Tax=Moniliophthora roreri (strain MCA 2997) TaxID=1381753 RepID=V2WXM3_MONRO|nr:NAD-binding protein [Moniliophthora roreri MCA 2997]